MQAQLTQAAQRIAVALTHRNFRLLWFGALTSSIGTWMQKIAQAWLIVTLTGSSSAFYLGLDRLAGRPLENLRVKAKLVPKVIINRGNVRSGTPANITNRGVLEPTLRKDNSAGFEKFYPRGLQLLHGYLLQRSHSNNRLKRLFESIKHAA